MVVFTYWGHPMVALFSNPNAHYFSSYRGWVYLEFPKFCNSITYNHTLNCTTIHCYSTCTVHLTLQYLPKIQFIIQICPRQCKTLEVELVLQNTSEWQRIVVKGENRIIYSLSSRLQHGYSVVAKRQSADKWATPWSWSGIYQTQYGYFVNTTCLLLEVCPDKNSQIIATKRVALFGFLDKQLLILQHKTYRKRENRLIVIPRRNYDDYSKLIIQIIFSTVLHLVILCNVKETVKRCLIPIKQLILLATGF